VWTETRNRLASDTTSKLTLLILSSLLLRFFIDLIEGRRPLPPLQAIKCKKKEIILAEKRQAEVDLYCLSVCHFPFSSTLTSRQNISTFDSPLPSPPPPSPSMGSADFSLLFNLTMTMTMMHSPPVLSFHISDAAADNALSTERVDLQSHGPATVPSRS
jgi:hypothetical protein